MEFSQKSRILLLVLFSAAILISFAAYLSTQSSSTNPNDSIMTPDPSPGPIPTDPNSKNNTSNEDILLTFTWYDWYPNDGTKEEKVTGASYTLDCSDTTNLSLCRKMSEQGGKLLFAELEPNITCTMQYGGPEVIMVKGNYGKTAIDTRFQRNNGCEISRFERIAPFFHELSGNNHIKSF